MQLEFGAPIPQVFLDGKADLKLVRNSIRAAESTGFTSLWTQDQVIGDVSLFECITLMSYAAACTETLRLGVSVIVFPIRNPVQLAKAVGSLDHLSNGRVSLGIGLGPPSSAANFYRSFGTEYSERVRRFNEGVKIMKALWTEQKITIDGEFFWLDGTDMEPKPVQKPHPPLIFGGQHPNALHRAARLADGYMGAGPTSTRSFASQVAKLREFLELENRDPDTFPVSKRVYLHVDNDEKKAKKVLDDFFEARYPWQIAARPDFVADICVWGSPQQCADGLAEVVEAGARMLVLNPIKDYVQQIETIGSEVVPLLR